VTIGCIEWQFDSWRNVEITARLPVSRLISTMLALHAVTVSNCVSPFGSHLNSIGMI
jgi:hypothetical protein